MFQAELTNLNKEEAQIRRLVNIAKPANLPPLLSPSNPVKPAGSTGSKVAPIIGSLKKVNSQKRKIVSIAILTSKKPRAIPFFFTDHQLIFCC